MLLSCLCVLAACAWKGEHHELRVGWREERVTDPKTGVLTENSGPDGKFWRGFNQVVAAGVSLWTGTVIPSVVESLSGAVEPVAAGVAKTIAAPGVVAENVTTTTQEVRR